MSTTPSTVTQKMADELSEENPQAVHVSLEIQGQSAARVRAAMAPLLAVGLSEDEALAHVLLIGADFQINRFASLISHRS